MGWPLTALAALATYAAIKAVQRAMPAPDDAAAAGVIEIDSDAHRE
jgi:hypothetical protein